MNQELPNSAETERAVLGAIMLDNRLVVNAAASLEPDDFYSMVHRRIFVAMIDLDGAFSEINPITVAELIKSSGETPDMLFISNLSYGLPPVMKIDHFVKVLKTKTALRRVVKSCAAISASALDNEDAAEVLTNMEQSANEIRKRAGFTGKGFREIREIQKEASIQFERLFKGDSTAIPTGFRQLDTATRGGIQPGDVWVVASLTGRGKSSWALGAARYQAEQKIPVALVSREMSDFENFTRLVAGAGSLPAWMIKPGMWPDTHERLMEWSPVVGSLPLWINSQTSNVFEIRSQIKELVRTKGIKSLFIDYLQLMNVTLESKNGSRAQEIATISRVLKEIAMENEIGVFALAQFNRMGANNERPEIHHLAESSGIEKDASLVLIIDMPSQREGQLEWDCTMRIAKHRNGPLLSLAYRYSGGTLTFQEAA